jgi:hypothetical protein
MLLSTRRALGLGIGSEMRWGSFRACMPRTGAATPMTAMQEKGYPSLHSHLSAKQQEERSTPTPDDMVCIPCTTQSTVASISGHMILRGPM